MSFYFNANEPHFDFAPAPLHALFNESDEEIADSLNIALETVRKHWRSIYERVIRLEPEFFPGGRTQGDARGPEKRRHLLNYLRMHLDEIRPRLCPRTRRGGEQ